jgi:protein DGCR14
MLIEAPPVVGVREKFTIETPAPAGLITDGQTEGKDDKKNEEQEVDPQLQQVPGKGMEVVIRDKEQEKELEADVMAPKKDTRSAGVDGWKFKVCQSVSSTLRTIFKSMSRPEIL